VVNSFVLVNFRSLEKPGSAKWATAEGIRSQWV
jgi:hypothetical protein